MEVGSCGSLQYCSDVISHQKQYEQSVLMSLSAQISDLSLRVFIPLPRLFTPLKNEDDPRDFCKESFLKDCALRSLKRFSKSQDLTHLESILRILEGGYLQNRHVLPALTRLFEALSVYSGSLTDSHWVCDEDKLTLSIWSMLSYFSHCSSRLSEKYPVLMDKIGENLISAFQKDTTLLHKIYAYETLKERKQHLSLEVIEMKIRKFYELQFEKPLLEKRGDFSIWGLSATLNFPECRKLDVIKGRKLLSLQEKVSWGESLWADRFQASPLSEQVLQSEEISLFTQKLNRIETEMEKKKKCIKKMTEYAALNPVKRMIQALYEYEQLEIVLSCTKELLTQEEEDRDSYIQWLVVIREGLKVMMTDRSLNLSPNQSIRVFIDVIKRIRDYFEHPEKHVLKLGYTSQIKKEQQRKELEADLFQDLKRMSQQIIVKMETRKMKMEQLLRPHPQIDVEDVLKALSSREELLPEESTADERQLLSKMFCKVHDFTQRIMEKSVHDRVDPAFLFNPLPYNTTPKESFYLLEEALQVLKDRVNSYERTQFETKLEQNVSFRLMVQRQISNCARILDRFMKSVKTLKFEYEGQYRLLEQYYYAVRDVRNFHTHDLWRKNIKGIVNTVYLLAYDCASMLNHLKNQTQHFEEGSLEKKVINKVVYKKLTLAGLKQAVTNGLNLNAFDYKDRSLLHFLAEHPSEPYFLMAEYIIEKGANIHQADHVHMRPLHYVAESGFIDLAKYLIQKGAVVDALCHNETTPAEIAQFYGHFELAQMLYTEMGITRSSEAKALLMAVNNLDSNEVQRLTDAGFKADIEYEGNLPLVTLFEKEGAEPREQIEIAQKLNTAGASINQQEPASGKTPLHAAASSTDQKEVIDFLMSLHPNVNIPDNTLKTPLHHATECENIRWMERLLRAKAHVNAKDISGDTPLLIACNRNNPSPEIIALLLKYGADFQAKNAYGTVLHHVAERSRKEAVSLVLEKGASPFSLGTQGLYRYNMPYANNSTVKKMLNERREYLFSHLTTEDQQLLMMQSRTEFLFRDLLGQEDLSLNTDFHGGIAP
ncbi:MAG: hypothetical protein K940chlam7_01753 [Chlamydiae bacterium]|nr:hypothetical protein [Chlamydiota bacterium]